MSGLGVGLGVGEKGYCVIQLCCRGKGKWTCANAGVAEQRSGREEIDLKST